MFDFHFRFSFLLQIEMLTNMASGMLADMTLKGVEQIIKVYMHLSRTENQKRAVVSHTSTISFCSCKGDT